MTVFYRGITGQQGQTCRIVLDDKFYEKDIAFQVDDDKYYIAGITIDGTEYRHNGVTYAHYYTDCMNGLCEIGLIVELKPITVTFKLDNCQGKEITTPTTTTYSVPYGTTISVSTSNSSPYTLKFTINTTNKIEVNFSSVLYEFTTTNWTTGAAVTSSVTITPNVTQRLIYVKHNNTTGAYETNPSRTDKFTINYNNGAYVCSYNFTDNDVENNELSYVYNSTQSTKTTYNIPAAYAVKSYGISKAQELVIITPVLEQAYIVLDFKEAIYESDTVTAKMNGIDVGKVLVKYNHGDYISDGAFTGTTLSYTVTLKNGTRATIIYTITGNPVYTFDKNYTVTEKQNVASIEVQPILILKNYSIDFG